MAFDHDGYGRPAKRSDRTVHHGTGPDRRSAAGTLASFRRKAVQSGTGEEVLIVTHDHWLLLTPELRRVQFHNVDNELLLDVSGEQFFQLIRYRDGGTMVLSSPDVLVDSVTAVPLGDSNSAGSNDIVYLAHRQSHDGGIGVAAMLVQKETTYNGQPVFRLTSLNGEVVLEGNSGGGVLFDGMLVGNMWGTILVEDVSGSGTSSPQQTSFSLVAQLPAEISVH